MSDKTPEQENIDTWTRLHEKLGRGPWSPEDSATLGFAMSALLDFAQRVVDERDTARRFAKGHPDPKQRILSGARAVILTTLAEPLRAKRNGT